MNYPDWVNALTWTDDGLIPVISQDHKTGRILMMAWMNRDALVKTIETGNAHYWSRSRKKMWMKGESSGHTQKVLEIRTDCDSDVIMLTIEQSGLACHTGRETCFYLKLENNQWVSTEPVIKDPEDIY